MVTVAVAVVTVIGAEVTGDVMTVAKAVVTRVLDRLT